jgi:hypothetical protein
MQKPCHGLIGRRKMHINTNVKLLTKKQKYKEVRNLFPESGIFSPLTGETRLKKQMPRQGLPVCSLRLPTTQLPRQGLPIRKG